MIVLNVPLNSATQTTETDTVQILPVKVFLIINAPPPPPLSHWLHSGLPVAFHSLTVMNNSQRDTLVRANTCGGAEGRDPGGHAKATQGGRMKII